MWIRLLTSKSCLPRVLLGDGAVSLTRLGKRRMEDKSLYVIISLEVCLSLDEFTLGEWRGDVRYLDVGQVRV